MKNEDQEDQDNKPAKSLLLPRDIARLDQAQTALADLFPPFWRNLFVKCVAEGFSETDALKLVQTYILSQSPNGVNGV